MNAENQNTEWKESWRDEYLKWICGFANAQGGTIVIGKNDGGDIVGVSDAAKLMEDIPNKVRDVLGIVVDVNRHQQNGLEYLEITVEPYPYPVNYKGQYHYRSGSTKQELKGAALNKFILQKTGRHWDSVPVLNVTINDLDSRAFDNFRKRATRSKRVEESVLGEKNEALLEHLRLTENQHLKRAAVLLFHPDPERFITGAYIKIGFFENQVDLLYQDEIHGTLFEQVEKTMDLLLTKYMRAIVSYEGIGRIETYLFPEAALREALLNAVAHKDYSSGNPIQIKVYDHKLSLWNTGHIPEGWSVEKFLNIHSSSPNNPDIANTFFRAGMIESWGRGIYKIINECEKAHVPAPTYEFYWGGIEVHFTAVKSSVKSSVKGSEKSSEKILKLVSDNNQMTIAELALAVGISTRAIEKQISKLKNSKQLARIGGDNGGYWQVLNPTP
ncbi:HTH domain-containing protein [Runella aurantiaca]|uniref:HTH domain-containing protein n=2 Tax=Runella aurantiaca TaxID=2282308 RepID=A0A369IBA1_9BACT|nr:HTH domain-containing protein [Runella aurantiaca]